MRLKVFLTLFILSFITQISFAQSDDNEESVPFTKDGTFKIDTLVKGYVKLTNGTTKDGLVRFNGSTVIFKTDSKGKNERFDTKEIINFVAGTDTFMVRIDTSVVATQIGRPPAQITKNVTFINRSFMRQVIYTNQVSLFKEVIVKSSGMPGMGGMGIAGGVTMMMGVGMTSNKIDFYLKRNNEQQYTKVPSRKKAFKTEMTKYFKDDASLVEKINNQLLQYKDLDVIIAAYKPKK